MPRRRLHGKTQQRRQKPRTRELKRRSPAPPRRQTDAAQPFERSAQLEPQDVQFLAAMRDLRVQPLPRPGLAPARQEAIARTHFAAAEEDQAAFQAAMSGLGVQPLGSTAPPPRRRPQADEPEDEPPAPGDNERRAPPLPASPRHPGATGSSSSARLARTPAGRALARGTTIQESPQDRALMEQALQTGVLKLQEKFQGAPARAKPRAAPPGRAARPRARLAQDQEPDAELDLHGKTQEEAIRMVQHFLLTAHRQRLRTALIITGRGLRSGGAGPVLRDAVQAWLERNGSPYLREFHPASGRHGGSGAWWVWMK